MQYAPLKNSEEHYISNQKIKATGNLEAPVEKPGILCYALIVRADIIGW